MASIATPLRTDLVSSMPIEQIFQKHLIDGPSYFFKEHREKPNEEYELRHDLSKSLEISINDIVIVGSAKLGFSVKTANFHKFDYKYSCSGNRNDRSDIDVAIVNRKLFEAIAERIFHMSRHFDNRWIEEYWKINPFNRRPTDLFPKYTKYLAQGWLRPDLMPGTWLAHADWMNICNNWYKKLDNRRVSVGFYSDWTYLKHYQMDNLIALQQRVKGLEI